MKMKKRILPCFITLLLSLSSCETYVHLIETGSTNSKYENYSWVYENDTIKISYDFWIPHGIMNFTVLNKSDKPIYIDWKKSSYISNDVKFDYWSDKEISNTEAYSLGYVYSAQKYSSSYSIGGSLTVANTTTEKPERITFIPPKSTFNKSLFIIQTKPFNDISGIGTKKVIQRSDKPTKTTTVYVLKGTTENKSPVRFRNFLTYSFTENFKKEYYADNGFFISFVTQMSLQNFRGKKGIDKNGYPAYEFPFYKPTSYYY